MAMKNSYSSIFYIDNSFPDRHPDRINAARAAVLVGKPGRRSSRIPLSRLTQRQLCLTCAAAWAAVPMAALRGPARDVAPVTRARQAAIYLAHVAFAHSLTQAGAMVGRDRTTARNACRRIEEQREDCRLDRCFDALEAALHGWSGVFAPEGRA